MSVNKSITIGVSVVIMSVMLIAGFGIIDSQTTDSQETVDSTSEWQSYEVTSTDTTISNEGYVWNNNGLEDSGGGS